MLVKIKAKYRCRGSQEGIFAVNPDFIYLAQSFEDGVILNMAQNFELVCPGMTLDEFVATMQNDHA